jgi:drug/metabolite transporter (DMT)-like permease
MIGGGLALLLVAIQQGEWSHFAVASISWLSLTGFCYLVIIGSMVGISAYVWLLQNAQAAAVSTYAFVNPVVALLLGWLIAGEPLTATIIGSAGIILAGVLIVITTPARKA